MYQYDIENDRGILNKWQENINTNVDNNFFGNWLPYTNFVNVAGQKECRKPWIIVAAGPSLDKNIQLLKDIDKSSVYIVCVDIVIFRLLEEGIMPNCVVNIDPSDFSQYWDKFDGGDNNCSLICPATTSPSHLQAWKGKKYIFNPIDNIAPEKTAALKYITNPSRKFGDIMNMGFVGATILQVVKDVRPINGIYLLGWDFAYTNNKVYCKGVLDRRYPLDDGSLKDAEYKNKDRLIQGIWTTGALEIYLRFALELINKYNIKTVNCTEGGIMVNNKNITNRPFKDVLKEKKLIKDK